MKVDISQQLTNRRPVQTEQAGPSAGHSGTKPLGELSPGERFVALITDIKVNQVTIKLENGEVLTARSQILPEARIGEETVFLVKENFQGQVLLEMLKSDAGTMETNILREALSNAGLFASGENLEIARTLMRSGMPIDANTLRSAAFFYYAGESFDIEKMLFLLREKFLPVEKNVQLLNGVLDKTVRLGDGLQTLAGMLINDVKDTQVQHRLMTVLLENPETIADAPELRAALDLLDSLRAMPEGEEKQAVRLKLMQTAGAGTFIELKDGEAPKPLNDYYKEIYDKTVRMRTEALAAGTEPELVRQLDSVLDNLEFMNHIRNYKEYLQIPFTLQGQEKQSELFIFKDKKNARAGSRQAGILISVDYLALGHVEAFINKSDRLLSLQFRSDTERALGIIRENFPALSSALIGKGYTISAASFKRVDEAFTVLDEVNPEDKTGAKQIKRFSFDMRV